MRAHAQRARGLALDHDRVLAVLGRAGRPRSTGRRRSPRSAPTCANGAVRATPRRRRAAAPPRRTRSTRVGERAQDAEREHVAALHVDRARADQPVALARQRAVRACGDDRVDVAEQQQPPAPLPLRRRIRSGACSGDEHGDALDRRLVGRQRRGDRERLLGARDVAADGDETPTSDRARARRARRCARPPRRSTGRRSVAFHAMAGSHVGDPAPDFTLEGTGRPLHAVRAPRRDRRPALLSRRRDAGLHQAVLLLPRPGRRRRLDATVVGISAQDLKSHKRFTEHHGLTVPLLADTDKQVAQAPTASRADARARAARPS